MKQVDQNDMNLNDKNKPPEKTPREIALEEQLEAYKQLLLQKQNETEEQRLEKEAEEARKAEAALEEDANLSALLKGAFHGKNVNQQSDDPDGTPGELSQKELVEVMGDAVAKAIDANTKLILGKVHEIAKGSDEKIAGTQKALLGMIAKMNVNDARSKHTDFDVYKDEIASIASKTNGLTAEDMYLLAKAKASSSVPGATQLESERPDSIVSRSADPDDQDFPMDRLRGGDDDKPYNPRQEFADGCNKAIDKVLAARANRR
jgi:hypothetical protein